MKSSSDSLPNPNQFSEQTQSKFDISVQILRSTRSPLNSFRIQKLRSRQLSNIADLSTTTVLTPT